MKRIIRSFFTVLLTGIILFATTGITFYIHECSGEGTKDVFIYPKILKHEATCSCEEESYEAGCENQPVHFNEPDCCKNSHLYVKASFIGFPVAGNLKSDFFPDIIPVDGLPFEPFKFEIPAITAKTIPDPSPPGSFGKDFLEAIHQLKIPVPFS